MTKPKRWFHRPAPTLRVRMPDWKITAAKRMRHNPTPAEARLWETLRCRQLKLPFWRQVPLLGYIVDFYCPAVTLAVEVDGDGHDPEYDAWRDGILAEHGIEVVRFSNAAVLHRQPIVLARIRIVMAQRPFQRPDAVYDPTRPKQKR